MAADLSRHDMILGATRGVCFFGTPHADFSRESWVKAMESQERFVRSQPQIRFRKAHASLWRWIDESAVDISRYFKTIIRRHQIPVASFYETRATPTDRGRLIVSSTAPIPRHEAHLLIGIGGQRSPSHTPYA
jgi:hypothetical protein